MNTKTLDRIRTLNRTAADLLGFFDKFHAKCREPNCDKHGNGFNKDDRFSAFKAHVSFDSWAGYYGHSGCSSLLGVDAEIGRDFFIKALNEHKALLFETMARLMAEESKSLADKARAEIADMQKMIDELAA